MQCPRLDHFVRFNTNGTVSRCGHMQSAPQFQSLEQMEQSTWLAEIKQSMNADQWPSECVRCQEMEQQNQHSIRQHAIDLHSKTQLTNYLQVGGVLDNVCNSACMTCNANHSSMIAGLVHRQQTQSAIKTIQLHKVDNSEAFWQLPQDRIAHLDINGGEPSYSKNYKHLLNNLPPNLETLRVNTNCATVITELANIAQRGISVTVTVSCDGVGPVHELVRWPIAWQTFVDNLMVYKTMPVKLNLWTTVSILNHADLPNIQAFAQLHGIDHSWAYLKEPAELAVDYADNQATQAYIRDQKHLRGIV